MDNVTVKEWVLITGMGLLSDDKDKQYAALYTMKIIFDYIMSQYLTCENAEYIDPDNRALIQEILSDAKYKLG